MYSRTETWDTEYNSCLGKVRKNRRRVERMNAYIVCFQLKRTLYLYGELTVGVSEKVEKQDRNEEK